MNSTLKLKLFEILCMGELLVSAVTLVFSWKILEINPQFSNYAAVFGYIISIFAMAASTSGMYGAINLRVSPILVNSVISSIIIGICLPTIGCHVLFLVAEKIDQSETGIMSRKRAWYFGTQIILFTVTQLLFTITTIMGYNLYKVIELHKSLNRKFETLLSQERMRRLLYSRNNYTDVVSRVQTAHKI